MLKLLGKGAYGRVYKVQRESDERTYALKETDLTSLTQMVSKWWASHRGWHHCDKHLNSRQQEAPSGYH